MINWNNAVIVLSCLLLTFICRKEILRVNPSRLALRLIASCLAVASLVMMAIPIPVKKPAVTKQAVLLTEGYNQDSLNAFLNGRKDVRVYPRDSLASIDVAIDSLHLFGYGLSSSEL